MKASLHNLTNVSVAFDGQDLTAGAQPLGCADPLPAAVAGNYLLVPACLGPAALARSDILWSSSIPNCVHCAPSPAKRSWLSKLARQHEKTPVLSVVEHYTPEGGRQGVGAEFFRRTYLQ